MKSVLISIQPKWCELIASGEKTVEVRKTKPKLEVPFKVYIYCTKGKDDLMSVSGKVQKLNTLVLDLTRENDIYDLNGKVIGEFVCDAVFPMSILYSNPNDRLASREFPFTCLTDKDIMDYLGNGGEGYGWNISDLVIYDEPRELGEFSTIDNEAVQKCENRFQTYYNFTDTGYIKNGFACSYKDQWCDKCKTKPIKRPFQSWGYVEVQTDAE